MVSPSPLAKKLLIKPGHRLALVNPPAGYPEALQPLPDGAAIVAGLMLGLDLVQVFVDDAAELERLGPAAFEAVKYDGLLWVSYRKGGKRGGTDLNRDSLRDLLRRRGLEAIALISIDDTWSSMRFRPADRVGK